MEGSSSSGGSAQWQVWRAPLALMEWTVAFWTSESSTLMSAAESSSTSSRIHSKAFAVATRAWLYSAVHSEQRLFRSDRGPH